MGHINVTDVHHYSVDFLVASLLGYLSSCNLLSPPNSLIHKLELGEILSLAYWFHLCLGWIYSVSIPWKKHLNWTMFPRIPFLECFYVSSLERCASWFWNRTRQLHAAPWGCLLLLYFELSHLTVYKATSVIACAWSRSEIQPRVAWPALLVRDSSATLYKSFLLHSLQWFWMDVDNFPYLCCFFSNSGRC